MYIGAIYKPPCAAFDAFVDELGGAIYSLNLNSSAECIVCGDFNINILNDDNYSNTFLTTMNSLSLVPVITTPTRITDNSATLIDNIFTTLPTDYTSGTIVSDISDHFPTFLIHKLIAQANPVLPEKVSYTIINDENMNNFNRSFCSLNFDPIYDNDDPSVSI